MEKIEDQVPATPRATSIVLVAGPVRLNDRLGHHDYLGGCALLADLLQATPGVSPLVISDGWPADETILEQAAAIVFYDRGGGKQGFLQSPQRMTRIKQAVAAGVGITMMHQTVAFPREFKELGKEWLGGVYVPGSSRRGHWKSWHQDFPPHPITAGVEPWKTRDGWLNQLAFVEAMSGITPLLWAGKRYKGSPQGGTREIVAWAYARPAGGRSFGFTGLDAHRAWALPGLRRFMVNGILWSAGLEAGDLGASSAVDPLKLASYLTPRKPRKMAVARLLKKLAARALGRRKW